jgi:hypothetical protein
VSEEELMTDSGSKLKYDRMLAIGTVTLAVASAIAALFSIVAVYVTLRTAAEQNSIADAQSRTSHALEFASIYFSAPLTSARETIKELYLGPYFKKTINSPDPNLAVAGLIRPNSSEQHSFDQLIALYDAISACANNRVCSVPMVVSLYGPEIRVTYLNWYGYVAKQREYNANFGCQTGLFLQGQNLASPDVSCSK